MITGNDKQSRKLNVVLVLRRLNAICYGGDVCYVGMVLFDPVYATRNKSSLFQGVCAKPLPINMTWG